MCSFDSQIGKWKLQLEFSLNAQFLPGKNSTQGHDIQAHLFLDSLLGFVGIQLKVADNPFATGFSP